MPRLDAVIFGATGFTGKHTVIHMVEFAKKYDIESWGVAGRSAEKLKTLMEEVAKKTGADVSSVPLIVADVCDEKSLQAMCEQTRVVINCCGPYRFYGEPVVKAAIEKKAHYVDVSGEPEFMERMQLRYNELARDAGVFVISACGWDSVPADMGVVHLQDHFQGTVNSVRSYLNVSVPRKVMAKSQGRGVINYGTWESLVSSLANISELSSLRRQLYSAPMPQLKPRLTRRIIHEKEGEKGYYLPFLGSDESVVYRSQRYLHQEKGARPVQFKAYIKSGNFVYTALSIFVAVLLYVMTKLSFTRKLLLDYPRLFSLGMVSREGPTEEVMNNNHFTFEFIGEGWADGTDLNNEPDKKVVTKLTGTNPGYGATCVALLCSAYTLLQSADLIPASGGVMTTGAAFRNTDMIQTLAENGLKYDVICTQKINM